MKHICIGTVAEVDLEKRIAYAYLIDGDQGTEYVAVRVPKKYPLPVPVDDGEFYDRYRRLPRAVDRCHIKIGYDYAYDLRFCKFKLRNPVYLGEAYRVKSCSSMRGLKERVK